VSFELPEKWVCGIPPRIDKHNDLQYGVDITQVKNGLCNADHRPFGSHNRQVDVSMARVFERLLIPIRLNDDAPRLRQPPLEALAGIGSDQEYPSASIIVDIRGHVTTPMSAGAAAMSMQMRYCPAFGLAAIQKLISRPRVTGCFLVKPVHAGNPSP
jgi:hypothetical protein